MKRTLVLFTMIIIATSVFGQDKTERKFWKKEARMYKKNPELLKDLVEANEDMTTELEVSEFESDSLKAIISRHENKMTDVNRKLAQAEKLLKDQKNLVTKLKEELTAVPKKEEVIKGTMYRVQIGAFAKLDLSAYAGRSDSFQEETHKGMRKYTIGVFKEKKDAEAFRSQIVMIGIRDAWIVKYIDGQRVENKGKPQAPSE